MKNGVSGAPCPECESIHTRTLNSGYTDEGYRLRRRRCIDCDAPSFLTVEVHVPATWTELETSYRLKQREYFRRKQGYQGRTSLARTRQTASLDVRVNVRRVETAA
jgi:transcriptional regulator NrdR family protein